MLPPSELKFGHFSDGIPPSIAWCPDYPKFTFIVGEVGQESLCAAFSESEKWLAPSASVDVYALYVDDFELLVEERKAVRFDSLEPDQRIGCLLAAGNELRLVAPPPHGRGGYVLLPMKLSGLQLPGGYQLAFPSWKAIKRLGDFDHLLFER